MHESSAYELILEEGDIRSSHRHMLLLGQERLGRVDEKTTAEIKSIQDLDRLDRLIKAVLTASTWQELLTTP